MVYNWPSILKTVDEVSQTGKGIDRSQALQLIGIPKELLGELADIADRTRQRFSGNKIDLCSIINARSGKCAEDCVFCAQSSRNQASSPIYPMKTADEIVGAAKVAEERGSRRFCIVTSGKKLSDHDFDTALEAISQIREKTGLQRCASLGELTETRAQLLKEAGLNRYHHNLETNRDFFPHICSTHTYDDRVKTINFVKDAHIETCVGGILNLGETSKQRIEFAFELRELNLVSIPINFLNPRPGTPLAKRLPISAVEATKYLAIFRLILPKSYIRLAGGRLETFGNQPELPFSAGVNGLLIGDLLTTKGLEVSSDISMLKSLGFGMSAF